MTHTDTTDAPDDTVIGELQKGYRIRDRVLRPALVAVANNPGSRTNPGQRADRSKQHDNGGNA